MITMTDKRIHYRLVNSDEKNRIKNNDKSIAALEGKNLLLDSPGGEEKFSGNMWKYQRSKSDSLRKMMIKEKYAKHLLKLKTSVKPDGAIMDQLGLFLIITVTTIYLAF